MAHAAPDFSPVSTLSALRFHKGWIARMQKAQAAIQRIPREDLSPAGIWLEDHGRFLLEEADALRRRLREIPLLPSVNKTPRILNLAREICREGENEITAPLILRICRDFSKDHEFIQAELHALPAAFSIALLEQLEEPVSFCIQEENLMQQAKKWIEDLPQDPPEPLPVNAALRQKILLLLAAREDVPGLEKMDSMLHEEREGEKITLRQYQQEMNSMALRCSRVIHSLRQLASIPFDRITERLSPIAAVLRNQLTYRQMDAESRAFYQARVCRIARKLHARESAVARCALQLTDGKEGAEGDVGYYLIDHPDLIGCQLFHRKFPSHLRRHKEGFFVSALLLGALFFFLLGPLMQIPLYLWPLMALCGSEITRIFFFRALRRHNPQRMLPRIHIRHLTKEQRTLVVVPTLLSSSRQALQMARQISTLRYANPDPHLDFMLLADFADAPEQQTAKDEEILHTAKEAMAALSQSVGGGCFYLHRQRAFSETQQCFSGRERKRGALESLNQLIVRGEAEDVFLYSSVDLRQLKGRYAFVITLDADTFLPPGTPQKLVGAMLHPLQKGRFSVIQPRMETATDTVKTRIQRFLGGMGGVDLYAHAAQDIYQDVFGRGSFIGKGIYAPEAFLSLTEGRMQKERLLSHDLMEGEWSRSALAEDIVLYDGHPASLSGWQKRLHRWTRGDWQLLPFLKDKNLSLLSRHKIWDNMRRSLVPFAQITLLLFGVLYSRPLLCLLGLPWPLSGIGKRLLFLPGKTYTLLDAVCRSLYRQFISKKGLLSWVTAAQAEQGSALPLPCILAQVIAGALLALFALLPTGFLPMAILGAAWAAAPLFAGLLDRPIRGERPLSDQQKQNIRTLCRDTWRFFEDSVTEETLHLPPDNVQMDPDKGPAMRTSPTNMGLYLLSCCAARELGFITTQEMARRMSQTMDTLEKLKTWKGHFFNWYELHQGAPLPPHFVSSVDSGNLAGCLFACAQYGRQRLSEMPEEYQSLPERMDTLFQKMDFSLLYDREKHLFYVGWDDDSKKFTPAHYDLMASEARITSFVGVMTRKVPLKHWQHLNRTTVRAGGGPALLSWGGTMFEYLMPALLLPHLPGTLLGESCKNAICAQMSDQHRLPFGVSESGYYAFDPDLNYQYRAFGLPILAHSSETEGRVIAPYASMLALPFFPGAAAANLEKMQHLHWMDHHGLFEAADYTPQRVDASPQLVKSHMAHHQGMILCAACNCLCRGALNRAFMAPPMARAHAYLLMEKAPRHAHRRPTMPPPRPNPAGSIYPARRPRAGLPVDAHVLAGKGMTWLITEKGQGFLSRDGLLLTRFFEEAGSQTGPQFYLKDQKSGAFCRPAVEGKAIFDAGSVVFSLDWQSLSIRMQCCVSPLSGAALTTLEIENHDKEERQMDAVSFLEIAQGPRAADQAHPNFRDLSIRILAHGENGLLSQRLARDEKEHIPPILHLVSGDISSLRRQGDRLLFLGRQGSYAQPMQLTEMESADFRLGDVIAPCLSLWAGMRIPANGSARICFQTIMADDPAALNALPFSKEKIRHAFSLASTQARMVLRFLGMDERALYLAQQIAGAIAFFGQPHQSILPSAPLSSLWQFGISSNLPLMLVLPASDQDKAMIRKMLQIHGWMRLQGVSSDLVFFCCEKEGYHKPLQDMIVHLCALSPSRDMLGKEGGVFILSGTKEDARSLESLARLTLRGGQSLSRQINALRTSLPAGHPKKRMPSLPLQPPPLSDFNGYGGFTRDMDYCIISPAPAPWHNLICNASFGTLVCDRAILHSYHGNSRLGMITRLSPDVHRGMDSEQFILQDQEGNDYNLTHGMALHEPGVTTYHTQCGQIQARLSLVAPENQSMSIRSITLHSQTGGSIRLHWLIRFALGEKPEFTRCQAKGSFIHAQCGSTDGIIWAGLKAAGAQAIAPAVCFGLSGSQQPLSLSTPGQGAGSIGFFTLERILNPHETLTLFAVLGWAEKEDQIAPAYDAICREGNQILRSTRALWQERLSGAALYAADFQLQCMLNRWLPYQTRTARLAARTGPYQAGGAFGFRDQLQDLLCLLHTEPSFARNHILLCASHQFEEGDVQHWWHAPRRGVRTRISDDKLFLPYLTALYIRITGDESILSEEIPYLSSLPLAENEDDRYESPDITAYTESLLMHCIRAMDSVRLGDHDLPLMGSGDWNDGMNRVGGKSGESVWLGFFYALTLKEFAPLCPREIKERYDGMRRRLLAGAENAWTGKWYLRAWYDTGEPMGGPHTDPPRIDLISQCFAVLAGAPREHGREALRWAVHLLYDRQKGMVKLLDPPFTPEERAGYIGGYLPGIRENGGQYTHAAPWLVMALCKIGEYDLAWEIARALLPAVHGDTHEKICIYRTEPYVLCGDVYAGENTGRGGWSWYTGSAAWMYYVFLTILLGFEKQGSCARLAPCPQSGMDEFTLVYRYGSAGYHFTADRDAPFPMMDGEKLQDGWVHLTDDGKTHEARFPMRNKE